MLRQQNDDGSGAAAPKVAGAGAARVFVALLPSVRVGTAIERGPALAHSPMLVGYPPTCRDTTTVTFKL